MKISVITASNRTEAARACVKKSLDKQIFRDFEWLIDKDTQKNEGDFYGLNKAWNRLIRRSKGELIVSIVDLTEFPEDTLGKLWNYYRKDPRSCINGVGYQYEGKKQIWEDPRITWVEGQGLCWIAPQYNEFRLTSFPRLGAFAVGGLDEEYDKVVGNSEKDFATRMFIKGYDFYLDKNLKYKFYKHEDHGKEWEEKYIKSCHLLKKHFDDIMENRRETMYYL